MKRFDRRSTFPALLFGMSKLGIVFQCEGEHGK
jgi:hypothetical protein